MIVTTGTDIPGQRIAQFLGIVRGIVVRSPGIRQGFLGGLKQFIGGNIEAYAEVCEQARRDAYERMVQHAEVIGADAIIVAEVAKLEQVPADQRLDPARLMQDLRATGKPAEYLPTVDVIVEHVKKQAVGGDVVCVFSNGGFGGIHQKLLAALQFRR